MATPPIPDPINTDIDIEVNANAFTNPMFPKTGILYIGDAGIEFRAQGSKGFVQVPWVELDIVKCDVYGEFVRSIEVVCKNGIALRFVIDRGDEVVRAINKHVDRSQLKAVGKNVEKMTKKSKFNLFKRDK